MAVYPKRRRRGCFPGLFLIFALLAALIWDGNTRLVTDEYSLGGARLPAGFDGFRIVQLSDLHTKEFGAGNEKLLDAVSDARPDIIAVTGDLIDSDRAEDYVRTLMTALTKIAPVYYVTGNHEWASGWVRDLFGILEECGVTVLRNEYVTLERGGDSIVLAGLEDPNGPYDMKKPGELMEEIRAAEGDKYVLVLSHRSERDADWPALGVDAVLSGHIHGGLIRLPGVGGLVSPNHTLFPKHSAGVWDDGGTQVLISRGLGNKKGTLRLFNNPELVVAVLEKQ